MTRKTSHRNAEALPRCLSDQPTTATCTKCGLDLTTACMQCNRVGTVDGAYCGGTCRALYKLGSPHVPATQFEEPATSAQ